VQAPSDGKELSEINAWDCPFTHKCIFAAAAGRCFIGEGVMASSALSPQAVRQLCGDIDDWKLAAIVGSGAGIQALEEALAWFNDEDDVMGEERKPLVGDAAALYEILTADATPQDEERIARK